VEKNQILNETTNPKTRKSRGIEKDREEKQELMIIAFF